MRRIIAGSLVNTARSRDLQIARVASTFGIVLEKLWGSERAVCVSFVSFAEGTLKGETASPAAKQEMALDAPRIQNEINRQLGAPLIKKIVINTKGF